MSKIAKKTYSPDLYRGATTVAGILAALLVLCGMLTANIRIAVQTVLVALMIAALTACLNIYSNLDVNVAYRFRKTYAAIFLARWTILFTATIYIIAIKTLPVPVKSLMAGAACIGWLRFRPKLLWLWSQNKIQKEGSEALQ